MIFYRFRLSICVLALTCACFFLAQHSYAGPAEDAEWCLIKATKRIKDQTMRRGNCLSYVVGWGSHHQNDLARDAIHAIVCENNVARALDYLRVCQCHNSGAHDAVASGASEIEDWARRRAPEIGLICPPPPQPVAPPEPQPLSSACICQYGNGQVAAWFTFRPYNFGATGPVEVSAFQCQDLSLCERFQQSNGYNYKYYTGKNKLYVDRWSENINLVTGSSMFSVWGTLQ